MAVIAYIDACVLYPMTVRNIFFEMHAQRLFQARWSTLAEAETKRNLEKNLGLEYGIKFDKTILDMRIASPDWQTEQDLKWSILTLGSKTDPKDAPHLAAAICGECTHLVTANIRHFDKKFAADNGVAVVTPDAFAMELLANNPTGVQSSLKKVLERLKKPPMTKEEYAAALAKNQLGSFAAAIAKFP